MASAAKKIGQAGYFFRLCYNLKHLIQDLLTFWLFIWFSANEVVVWSTLSKIITEWITMRLMINSTDYGDCLTFPQAPP